MEQVSKEQTKAALSVLMVLADAIRDLSEVPSGELYAVVSGTLSLDSYNKALGLLKRSGLVEEKNHLLRWIGPAKV